MRTVGLACGRHWVKELAVAIVQGAGGAMKEEVTPLPPSVQQVLELSPYAMCASDIRVRLSPPSRHLHLYQTLKHLTIKARTMHPDCSSTAIPRSSTLDL
jgi:hypothetical protein